MISTQLFAFILFNALVYQCDAYCQCQNPTAPSNQESGTYHSPDWPRTNCNVKCVVEIVPSSTKSLFVRIYSVRKFNLWQTYMINGDINTIPINTKYYGASRNIEINLPMNSGLRFEYLGHYSAWADWGNFEVSFNRLNYDVDSCDPIIKTVTDNTTVIQSQKETNWNFCHYIVSINQNLENSKEKYLIDVVNNEESNVAIEKLGVSSYTLPQITITPVNNKCDCDKTDIIIPDFGALNLKSPGFSEQICPGLKCSTIVKMDDIALDMENDTESVLLITIRSTLQGQDRLRFSRNGDYFFSTDNTGHLGNNEIIEFVTSSESITLDYSTSMNMDSKEYDINITHLVIPAACHCSFYNEKWLDKPGSLSIPIPPECGFVYCNWNINVSNSKQLSTVFKFEVKNASVNDEVQIFTKSKKTVYKKNDFTQLRQFSTKDQKPSFVFMRKNGSDGAHTHLNLSWSLSQTQNCNGDVVTAHLTKEKYVFANKEWPNVYSANENCRYLFIAPENHTIQINVEIINIEHYHDHLKFYNGNSTDNKNLIKSFSGKFKNLTLNSTGEQLSVVFTTDATTSKHGFHINFITVEKSISAPTVSRRKLIPILTSLRIICSRILKFSFFSTLCIIISLTLVFVYYKYKHVLQTQSSHIVSFFNNGNDPTVNILQNQEI